MITTLRRRSLLAGSLLCLCAALAAGCKGRSAPEPANSTSEAVALVAPEWVLGTWRVDVRSSLEQVELDPEQQLLGMILGATTRVELTLHEDGGYESESRAGHTVRRRSGTWRMLELVDDSAVRYELTLEGRDPEQVLARLRDDGSVLLTRDEDTLVLRRPRDRAATGSDGDTATTEDTADDDAVDDATDDDDADDDTAGGDAAAAAPDAPGDVAGDPTANADDSTPALADPAAEQ